MSQGLTQKLQSLTTQIFRCGGLSTQTEQGDRVNLLEVASWLIFFCLASGWYFFVFQPQRQRNELLTGRMEVLNAQANAEEVELNRVRREVNALEKGNKQAWERAARLQLGWIKPGEYLNLADARRGLPSFAQSQGLPRSSGAPRPNPAPAPARPPIPQTARSPVDGNANVEIAARSLPLHVSNTQPLRPHTTAPPLDPASRSDRAPWTLSHPEYVGYRPPH